MNYAQFIESKIIHTPKSGFLIADTDLHPSNLPHQRDIIRWAIEGGRRAIFASFGLGKTQIQLEISRITTEKKSGKALIVCPLGVKQEFKADAQRLGIHVEYCRTMAEVENSTALVILTNYERVRDGDIQPSYFICASLDEASVLRSYGSKTYQQFLTLFSEVKYRYVCTATPSPNKYKELIHYAGFLGVMDTGEALTRFFKRDSTKANNLTIHPHKEREFWLWVSSWGLFITRPSDLGYSDAGYDLPELSVHWHRIDIAMDGENVDSRGQSTLFREVAFDLRTAAAEKRSSLTERVAKACEIVADGGSSKHWVIWHHLEAEREAVEKALPESTSVYGSQKDELKESLLIGFARGEYRILATKPEIAGQGCNFQKHCHSAIFLGIDYKFNDFIQAIHRIQRFQQPHPCEIHILYTDSEENIRKELEAKWQRHIELVAEMTTIIRTYGLGHATHAELRRSIGVERSVVHGQSYTCVHNDCVDETARMEENSVDMIVTSIPFSNHYEYTPSYNDFGHTKSDKHFFQQMNFLTPNLLRVLKPGRVAAIHVKDRILFGSVTGYGMPSVNPFHAKTIAHYIKHGFIYMGMITIETDVVRENNQTYRLGWTEQCKDGSKMGIGSPEYLLLFRKLPTDTSRAYADTPVTKSKAEYTRGRWQIDARAKWNSSGNRLLSDREIAALDVATLASLFYDRHAEQVYNFADHVAMANQMDACGKLPATFESLRVPGRYEWLWDDVVRMRTLNSQQSQSKEQNHLCPLQFDIVERAIERWTNPGELVLDPFGGLMTVPYCAVNLGRRGMGIELNPDYFRAGSRYCRQAEYKKSVPTLFDIAS